VNSSLRSRPCSTSAVLTNSTTRIASYALGEEVWQAVVADWRTAPLAQLAATLVLPKADTSP
jgi:hypothetical protein